MNICININKITSIFYILSYMCLYSCSNKNNIKVTEPIAVGTKINLMEYAFKPTGIGKDTVNNFIKHSSQYKILTYVNSYCEPCWNYAVQWKEHLKYFKEYPNVSFYCYVHATPQDFELRNADAKLDFPVFLDSSERFRIVNHLGSDPNKLTFLLNKENEILLIGPPFTKEMREKYLSIISKKE